MVKVIKRITNVKTGEKTEVEYDHIPKITPPQDRGIDPDKLRQALLDKNIISSIDELEPEVQQ